ncbi:MAG: TadE/TadG family type IV pilus assembly protein [Oleiphilaceae bacterium]|nr:TadE/TadG family type IV pilus assembly protein [Oleiphilaceae bacterium]
MRHKRRVIRHQQGGFSLVEHIWLWPLLVMLTLGTVQLSLLFKTRATVNNATFLAAREGSINHADKSLMLQKFAFAMAPLYVKASPNPLKLKKQQRVQVIKANAGYGAIQVISPSPAIFRAFAVKQYSLEGQPGKLREREFLQVPNDNLILRSDTPKTVKVGRKQVAINLQDANLLKIRGHWCYELQVPVVNVLIRRTMHTLGASSHPHWANCEVVSFATGKHFIPVSGHSVVRMQSPIRCVDAACNNLK